MIRLNGDAVEFDIEHQSDAWILIVTTPNCAWCPKVKAIFADEENVRVVEMSARGSYDLVDRLDIQSAPTTILYWNRVEVERVVGYDDQKRIQLENMLGMAREMNGHG